MGDVTPDIGHTMAEPDPVNHAGQEREAWRATAIDAEQEVIDLQATVERLRKELADVRAELESERQRGNRLAIDADRLREMNAELRANPEGVDLMERWKLHNEIARLREAGDRLAAICERDWPGDVRAWREARNA